MISIVEWQHSKLKLSALNLTLSVIGCCLVEQWIQAAGGIWWKFKCILIITLLHWGAGQSSNSTCLHFHPPLNASNLPEFPDPFFGGFLVSKKWFGELDTSYVTWHVSKKRTFYFPTHQTHFTELLSALNFGDENKECFLSGSFFETRGERTVFWRPNTNTNNIRQKISTEYEYEYYSTKIFHRIRIRILFGLKISPNTNTNSRLFECIRMYSNIFKYILSQMDIYAKF